METEILFEEIQPFYKPLFSKRTLKGISLALLCFSIVLFFVLKQNKEGISFFALALSVVFLVFRVRYESSMELIMQIRTDGIYVSFQPFQKTTTICLWENMDQLFIRTYNPLKEYGGYGLRLGKGNTALNVSGNIGLQIVFTDGTKLLIGTTQPNEINEVLAKLGKLSFPA